VKLIVQIPCYNEEETLPEVIADIPRRIDGIDEVEIVVIDDGSTDRTVEVARACGADHVLRIGGNRGLANAFSCGIDYALRAGADIVVNTDGDHQYKGRDIPRLVQPILRGEAEIVIGDRQIRNHPEFSRLKILLQLTGSWAVRKLSRTSVPDATSGFRAYSREAAMRIHVISRFSYTLETLIQAGVENIKVASIPILTNPKRRPSRLFRGMFQYLRSSTITLIRIYMVYSPLKTFLLAGAIAWLAGTLLACRFLWSYILGDGAGHIQSLLAAAVLFIAGFSLGIAGFLADLVGANRRLLEKALHHAKLQEEDILRLRKEIEAIKEREEVPMETPEIAAFPPSRRS